MNKKNILLISTGGTILSIDSPHGLHPGIDEKELLFFPGHEKYNIFTHSLMMLDSSNVQPEEWALIAEYIFANRLNYDGIVITHGTDTMAYTASALTFMLPGIDRPIVLTGSQLPITNILSDAYANLQCAFAMAASGMNGIFIAFDREIFLGCRAVKVRTSSLHAFESINYPLIATINSHGFVLKKNYIPDTEHKCILKNKINNQVALVKLIPGINPALFSSFSNIGYRGIVIEAFGSGGVNFLRRNIISEIQKLVKQNIIVVICSQCLYESTDMTIYEVGKRLLNSGIVSAKDMTTESAITKLMWLLGQDLTQNEILSLFQKNLHGEILE